MHSPSQNALTLTALAALGLAVVSPAAAQSAHLTIQSQPGDLLGLGDNYDITYTPQNTQYGAFLAQLQAFVGAAPPNHAHFYFFKVAVPYKTFDQSSLDFGTEKVGVALTPGVYTDAQRASFAAPGHPGLDVQLNGFGNNTLTGSFTVQDITYSTTPNAFGGTTYVLETFDVSFVQLGQGSTAPLFGQFSYRSAAALNPLTSLTFPSPVSGGSVLSGMVTLSGPAPADTVVGLSSSDSSVIRLHRSVIVPAGASSATFEIDTYRSHVTRVVTVTATLGTVVQTQTLTITGR